MKIKEMNFWFWVSRLLPVKVVYFSFIHVMVHATTGKYGSTEVPELTGMDAIKRYGDDNLFKGELNA